MLFRSVYAQTARRAADKVKADGIGIGLGHQFRVGWRGHATNLYFKQRIDLSCVATGRSGVNGCGSALFTNRKSLRGQYGVQEGMVNGRNDTCENEAPLWRHSAPKIDTPETRPR